MMRRGTVLLVDDEDVVLRMQAAAVRQFGFQAVIADCASAGLEAVQEHKPDLIVTDVQMPGEGGFDFVSTLTSKGHKTMPVIYLTGYDDVDLVLGGLRAGGDDFIIKGGSIEALRRRIAFWMVSGFKGLPAELRRRALVLANADRKGVFTGVEAALDIKHALISGIANQVCDELTANGEGFGQSLIERVAVIGRASKLLIDTAENAGDLIRFPDYLRLICQRLKRPWLDDLSPLFSEFDTWSQDIRFVRAGPSPLMAMADYDAA